MRRVMYLMCFLTMAVLFTIVYYFSYHDSGPVTEPVRHTALPETEAGEADTKESQSVRVVNEEQKPIVTANAVCILQEHNMTNDWMTEKSYTVPLELIGMTRDEVINYIARYTAGMSEEEQNLVHYELISFSNDQLVIRKTFLSQEDVAYTYWVKSVAGRLMVYLADQVTVYIRTDIEVDKLPEEEQIALKTGKYITNMQELFNYLESCTS